MNKILKLVACVSAPLATGAIAGIVTSQNINTWYVFLTKPSFNPPNFLFAPVWTSLYILMGISGYIILQSPPSAAKKHAIMVFIIQWVVNFAWSFLFFNFHLLGISFIEILFMWASILYMIITFKKINKTAAYLQIPYLCWVSFATVLNGSIFWLNQ